MENMQKRGRPKLEEISSLIKEGAQSKSPIRCRFCKRAFPREKSLQAHQRIHTGERPYRCTHPGCHKSFVQSGQLRTHQRLHTGEKPFRCNECKNRFTHANRRCPDHPSAGVRRDEQNGSVTNSGTTTPLSANNTPIKAEPENIEFEIVSPSKGYNISNDDNNSNTKIKSNNTSLATAVALQLQANKPTARTALCNYENLTYYNQWQRGDEILGALALIELSKCH